MNRMLELVARPSHDTLVDYLAESVNSLAAGGADFAALVLMNTTAIHVEALVDRMN